MYLINNRNHDFYFIIWWSNFVILTFFLHRLFLLGLETYGKGDWKSISRHVVVTKNPAQVASHAQKHFQRQEKDEENKKRLSIFDACSSSHTKPADNWELFQHIYSNWKFWLVSRDCKFFSDKETTK